MTAEAECSQAGHDEEKEIGGAGCYAPYDVRLPEPTHKDVGLDNVLHTRAVGLEDLGEVVDALVLFGCQPPPIFRMQLIRGGGERVREEEWVSVR